jgi:DNA-directed RNA polymerase specialized sigma24 family protein
VRNAQPPPSNSPILDQEAPLRSDAELLHAARTDAQAFRELYDRYASRIYGYHLRRSGDTDAAHDLTAETFAQAWLARRRFRDRAAGSAIPWLFGIARNVLLMSVRRRRLERSACERLGILERLDAEPAVVEPEESWLDGLEEPSQTCRTASATRSAVAAALGTSAPSARLRVHRGLTTLRNRLGNGRETPT